MIIWSLAGCSFVSKYKTNSFLAELCIKTSLVLTKCSRIPPTPHAALNQFDIFSKVSNKTVSQVLTRLLNELNKCEWQ